MGNPISMRSSATSLVCCHCILLAAGGCASLAPYASVECRDDAGCVDSYDAAPVTTAPVDSGQPLEAQLPASFAPVLEPVGEPGRLSLVATPLEEFWESDAQGMYVDELLSLYVDLLAFGLILPPPPVGVGRDTGRPFLQRLCLELGEEEFLCRQRYGE